MANIDLIPTATLADMRMAIPMLGTTNTFVIVGQPGIGKTYLFYGFKKDLGSKYHYVYYDAANADYGDLSSRVPNLAERKIVQCLSDLIPMDGKPVMLMIDELGKVPKLMQPTMARLLLDHMIGDTRLPEGSIVFGTSNNAGDGVGDIFPGHTRSRVAFVPLRNPTNEEWAVWATENNIDPMLRAWAIMTPRAFASYTQGGQEENSMIFNPRRTDRQYACGRSIAKCDPIVRNRAKLGSDLTLALLTGTVGLAAARSMVNMFSVKDEVVPFKDIVANPDTCQVPENPAAIYLCVFDAVDNIKTQSDLTAFMTYVERINSREVTGVFYSQLIENKPTAKLAHGSPVIQKWVRENYKVLI